MNFQWILNSEIKEEKPHKYINYQIKPISKFEYMFRQLYIFSKFPLLQYLKLNVRFNSFSWDSLRTRSLFTLMNNCC